MTGSRAAQGGPGSRIAGIMAAGVLAAGCLLAGAGPAAATAVVYAAVRARGSGDCFSPADACTLSAALAQVAAGGIVELVTPGTARYVGNWTVATAGTPGRHAVTIRALAGLSSEPILDGDGPDAPQGETCSTASCDGPVLTVPASGHLTITGITVADGENSSGNHAGSGLLATGSATVTDCTFTGNAIYGAGAAISSGKRSLTVTGSTFTGNDAYAHGAAISSGEDGEGSLTVTRSTFTGNAAFTGMAGGGAGGAIYSDGSSLTVTAATFHGNSSGEGGAIATAGAGPARVTASTFTHNSVNYSGGAISDISTPSFTVTDSTFTDNHDGQYGGAIFATGPAGTGSLTVTASTFTGNRADEHGGTIFADTGSVQVAADVFTGWCDRAGATWNDAGYNVAGNTSCFAKAPPGTDVDAGSTAALKLGPLARHGGPTRTIVPLPGSPAIGIIPDPASVTLGGSQIALCPAIDQRGYASTPGPLRRGLGADHSHPRGGQVILTMVNSATPVLYQVSCPEAAACAAAAVIADPPPGGARSPQVTCQK